MKDSSFPMALFFIDVDEFIYIHDVQYRSLPMILSSVGGLFSMILTIVVPILVWYIKRSFQKQLRRDIKNLHTISDHKAKSKINHELSLHGILKFREEVEIEMAEMKSMI